MSILAGPTRTSAMVGVLVLHVVSLVVGSEADRVRLLEGCICKSLRTWDAGYGVYGLGHSV
jgi:hypothetical protein